MNRATRWAVVAAVLAASMRTAIAAEQIIPSRASYQAKILEDEGAKVCELMLTAANPQGPETVLASALVGLDKNRQAVVAGFSLTVSDGQTPFVSITRAGFSSAGFSSEGMERVVDQDNSVWIWMNASTTVEFLTAFLSGNFDLSFARAGSKVLRTYHIEAAPAANLREGFIKCATGLSPGDEAAAPAPPAASLETIARAGTASPVGPETTRTARARVMRSAPVTPAR